MFSQRRKTLYNSLRHAAELSYTAGQITAALESCRLRPDIRGEALSLEQFIELEKALEQ